MKYMAAPIEFAFVEGLAPSNSKGKRTYKTREHHRTGYHTGSVKPVDKEPCRSKDQLLLPALDPMILRSSHWTHLNTSSINLNILQSVEHPKKTNALPHPPFGRGTGSRLRHQRFCRSWQWPKGSRWSERCMYLTSTLSSLIFSPKLKLQTTQDWKKGRGAANGTDSKGL